MDNRKVYGYLARGNKYGIRRIKHQRNVATKWKIPKQGLTNVEIQILKLRGKRDSTTVD